MVSWSRGPRVGIDEGIMAGLRREAFMLPNRQACTLVLNPVSAEPRLPLQT